MDRKTLQLRKLELQIKELKWAGWRTAVTYVLTLATVVVGWMTWTSQHEKDVQTTRDSRRIVLEDRFFKARDTLSSPNAALRANAALDLGAFTRDSAKGIDIDEATVDHTVTVLINRIKIEEDPEVIGAITAVLGNSSRKSIDNIVAANRLTSFELARVYGQELGTSSAYDDQRAADKLDAEIAQNVPAVEIGRDIAVTTPFSAKTIAYHNFKYLTEGRAVPVARAKRDRDERIKELRHAATVIVATGIALESLLKNNSGKLYEVNLNEAVLYAVDVRGIDFAHASLKRVYMSGDAAAADFTKCDLRGADLADLVLARAKIVDAHIDDTHFNDLRELGPHGQLLGSQADFTGSQWKSSYMWLDAPGDPDRAWRTPNWLSHIPRKSKRSGGAGVPGT
jgi:hypothetical protein